MARDLQHYFYWTKSNLAQMVEDKHFFFERRGKHLLTPLFIKLACIRKIKYLFIVCFSLTSGVLSRQQFSSCLCERDTVTTPIKTKTKQCCSSLSLNIVHACFCSSYLRCFTLQQVLIFLLLIFM